MGGLNRKRIGMSLGTPVVASALVLSSLSGAPAQARTVSARTWQASTVTVRQAAAVARIRKQGARVSAARIRQMTDAACSGYKWTSDVKMDWIWSSKRRPEEFVHGANHGFERFYRSGNELCITVAALPGDTNRSMRRGLYAFSARRGRPSHYMRAQTGKYFAGPFKLVLHKGDAYAVKATVVLKSGWYRSHGHKWWVVTKYAAVQRPVYYRR